MQLIKLITLLLIAGTTNASDLVISAGAGNGELSFTRPIQDGVRWRIGAKANFLDEDKTVSNTAFEMSSSNAGPFVAIDFYSQENQQFFVSLGLSVGNQNMGAKLYDPDGDYTALGSGFNAKTDLGILDPQEGLVTANARSNAVVPFISMTATYPLAEQTSLGLTLALQTNLGIESDIQINDPGFDPTTNTIFKADQFDGTGKQSYLNAVAKAEAAVSEAENELSSAINSMLSKPVIMLTLHHRF
ncbi:MAG: hypothetical protein HWE20_10230 [Gammaproteobacteria bacterium]|nr:hypothetical protein [Gammaproteobacteria bacterium]